MKVGVDSYCFHRQFGDPYPGLQSPAAEHWTVWDFLDRAGAMRAEGVSLEACYLPDDDAFLGQLRDVLDARGFERVWAWGHPDGLGSGTRPEAAADLIHHLGIARRLGADVMRVCLGGRRTRPASWPDHKAALLRMLPPLLEAAAHEGVVMAAENHLDLLADEFVELLEAVGSPWLGVCLDTGNNVRMGEDPAEVIRKLAPYACATHVKDVAPLPGADTPFASWPSVSVGHGVVDLSRALHDLREVGFGGLLAVELDYLHPDHANDEEAVVRESLGTVRALLAR